MLRYRNSADMPRFAARNAVICLDLDQPRTTKQYKSGPDMHCCTFGPDLLRFEQSSTGAGGAGENPRGPWASAGAGGVRQGPPETSSPRRRSAGIWDSRWSLRAPRNRRAPPETPGRARNPAAHQERKSTRLRRDRRSRNRRHRRHGRGHRSTRPRPRRQTSRRSRPRRRPPAPSTRP